MKLLFIENRYKTFFFESITKELTVKGYEIHWLIQNKEFTPSSEFKLHSIRYPKGNYKFVKDEAVETVIKSDRQLNHFDKKDTSYFYYYNEKIRKLLKKIKPDLVFGESTAFHELLTINNCKELDILYLNPSTCRYPIGRFSFYKYDTLEPYQGSKEILSKKDAEITIDQIVNRKTVPDYMKPIPVSNNKKVKDQFKKVYSYIKGERFNTPNPLIKYKLEKLKVSNILEWDNIAVNSIDEDTKFKVLYPLQMQPEANIDVWGRKHRNQSKLISKIANQLPKNAVLYVKPNPKSKYELNKDIIKVIKENEKIIPLKHSSKMDAVLPKIDLVITVTGTIAIECILSNKPVVNLVNTINNEAKNCSYIDLKENELENQINKVKEDKFYKLNISEKIDFINILNSSSYKGIVSDPFSDLNCLSEYNMNNIEKAFNDILNKTTNNVN